MQPGVLDRDKAAALKASACRDSPSDSSRSTTRPSSAGRVHPRTPSARTTQRAPRHRAPQRGHDLRRVRPDRGELGADLGRVLALGPDHLSAYNLTFEEDTRFKRWLDRGRLERSPEEVELTMFETTRRLTAEHGLDAYEISNHARPDEECAHNIGYWRNGAYVGIGPGAVSKVGHSRAGNPRGIAPYLRRVAARVTHSLARGPGSRCASGGDLVAGPPPRRRRRSGARRTAGADRVRRGSCPPRRGAAGPRPRAPSLGRVQAHAARSPSPTRWRSVPRTPRLMGSAAGLRAAWGGRAARLDARGSRGRALTREADDRPVRQPLEARVRQTRVGRALRGQWRRRRRRRGGVARALRLAGLEEQHPGACPSPRRADAGSPDRSTPRVRARGAVRATSSRRR